MPEPTPQLLLCDCLGTMRPDVEAIARGTGLRCGRVHHHLCRREAGVVAAALKAGRPVIIACGQEAPAFRELAEELGAEERLVCVDIRDRAGWSEDTEVGPKMAALLAESLLPPPAVPVIEVESAGRCLVYGAGEQALAAAERLAPHLAVTCLLTEPVEFLPPAAEMEVATGRIRRLEGALGRFRVIVDAFAEREPGGRGMLGFGRPRDGAEAESDIVVDLSGGTPLVPAPAKRDGYLRADPGDPLAVERALFEAVQLVGSFEKPLHIRFEASLCAHSRAGQTGCTRCLDICPTGAISPDGDSVRIDPHVCAGCGGCHAVCPSAAASSDDPPVAHVFRRLHTLAEVFAAAGGAAPRLLVHDTEHGAEMIRLAARFGRGLPADVVPFEVRALNLFGHAEQLAALGVGFRAVDMLVSPRTERAPLEAQVALAEAIVAGVGAAAPDGGARLRLVEPADPDALSDLLYAGGPPPIGVEPILPLGGRRDTVRLAARALAGGAPPEAPVPLPPESPYGAIEIDTEACTLCLSCAGLCPTGAILDNPDRPQVSFREEACIQCGICATICPEKAIRLVPRLDLSDAALAPRVLNEEEPFACISCGRPFGVRSSIERIIARLEQKHWMYTDSDNVQLIQMCDDCRVKAQFHMENAPMRLGMARGPRTTDDYLAGRVGDDDDADGDA